MNEHRPLLQSVFHRSGPSRGAYLWVQIVHAVVDHGISLDEIARAHWSDPISGGYRRIMLSAGVWLTVRKEAFPVPAFRGPPEPTHLRYKERLVGWLRKDPFLQRVFEEAGRERPSADHHVRIIETFRKPHSVKDLLHRPRW